ncbi:unnamed protein product [Ectocarpus fasciculatus]
MDHDTAVEHSASETRGTGSSGSSAEDSKDDATSSPEQALREQHDMNQAAPAATVPRVLPNHELPGTAVETLPQGPEVALQAPAGSGGGAPAEPKATSLENLMLPCEGAAGCDSDSDDDRSQSEATTGSVSPALAACFSSDATPTGGGPPSPPASVAEPAAAAKEAPSCMFPQTGPPEGKIIPLAPSSSGVIMSQQQQQAGYHHPPSEPTFSPSLAAAVPPVSAAVLHGEPAAGAAAAAAAAEEGEKNARMSSSPSAKEPPSSSSEEGATPEQGHDSFVPPSPLQEHGGQNQGRQEAAPAASVATTTITTLEEGSDDTNVHADDTQDLVGGAHGDRSIPDNPASSTLLSASPPSYELQHRFVQHTGQRVNEPYQPPAVLHPGGAATDLIAAAAATTSTHTHFHDGGLQQPAFGNHNAYAQPPPAAAAAAYYGHHQPTQYSAGGPTPPPPPGTMLGGAGLPYHSHHSGFNLPDTGRAPLLSAPLPPGGGGDRYDLVLPPGAVYDQHHEHQHVYHPHQALHPQQQRQLELGRPGLLASAATATPAEHPRPDATAGAPQTFTEGVLTIPQSGSSGATASGGARGGAAAAAAVLGTAAGVMAAAAAGGRADGDAVQNNAYNDIGLVVTRTKELEKIMRDSFHATGEKSM